MKIGAVRHVYVQSSVHDESISKGVKNENLCTQCLINMQIVSL